MIEVFSMETLTRAVNSFNNPSGVCIGMPLYNESAHLETALNSILKQSFAGYALIVSDNCSTDSTCRIVNKLCRDDDRVILFRNTRNIGMVNNFRLTVHIADRLFPDAQYFCWVSGHDLYDQKWLENLYNEIEGDQTIALVYPRLRELIGEKRIESKFAFDNSKYNNLASRFMYTVKSLTTSGAMAYGLYRINSLIKSGIYREILGPDVFLMIELSMYGKFRLVDNYLWTRRAKPKPKSVSGRQRRFLYNTKRPPLISYIPMWLQHPLLFIHLYFSKLGMNAFRFSYIIFYNRIKKVLFRKIKRSKANYPFKKALYEYFKS